MTSDPSIAHALSSRLVTSEYPRRWGIAGHRAQKIGFEDPQLRLQKGDFHDKASVLAAVKGQDAVIVTAAAGSLKTYKEQPQYFSLGTGLVIEAMKAHGVNRLVVLSALGVAESGPLLPLLVKPILLAILKLPYADHVVQEKQATTSGLEWVIARPGRLTDGPATRVYVKEPALKKVPAAISRADVADFLVEAGTTPAWVKKAVQLGG